MLSFGLKENIQLFSLKEKGRVFFSVLSPHKFSICDTSGAEFSNYTGGGIALQVKVPLTVTFVSLFIMYLFLDVQSEYVQLT